MSGAQDAATVLGAQTPPAGVVLGATSYGPGMVRQTVSDIDSAQREKEKKQAPIYAQMQADVASDRERVKKAEADYTPVPETKPPPVPENDPLKGFSSAASIFALMASALTHTPAINAMNGMAAAINATKANDWKAYEEGYKQWKENTDLAIEKHKLQAADMQTALEKMQTDLSTGVAMAKAVAAASDDRIATKLLEEGQYEKLGQYQLAQATAARGMQESALRVQEMMPVAIASQRLTAALKSGDPAEISAASSMMQQIKDPAAFTTENNEKQARAVAADPANYKDGKLTDDAFQKMMTFDPKLAMDVRKSGFEKSYAPATYRLPDGSNVTAIVSPDGTAREVGTNRVVNLAGAVKGGPETGAQNKERNVETLASAQVERMNQSRKDANQAPLTEPEKAQASLDARWIIEGDEAAAKAKATGQAKQELQPKKLALNDNAVDFEARQLLLTGQMPAMGLASGDARMQIINRAGDLAAEQGHTVEDYIAGRAEWKADVASVGQITKIADAVQGFENTALANMQTAERLMDRGAGTSLGPVVNRWLQAGKQATGDPDVAAFNTAMGTVSSEYGKIISGGSASIASTPEGAREEAAEWLNKIQSPDAIRAQFAVARQDMANRKNSLFEQREAITHRLRTEKLSDQQPEGQAAPSAASPTENATGTSKSGRPIIFRNGQWEYQ